MVTSWRGGHGFRDKWNLIIVEAIREIFNVEAVKFSWFRSIPGGLDAEGGSRQSLPINQINKLIIHRNNNY